MKTRHIPLSIQKKLQKEYDINNLTFGSLNILQPGNCKFDIVCSVEVLEHIKEDEAAAYNMNNLAKKYVYCLVPFAEQALNEDKKWREAVFTKFGHYVAGYDVKTLVRLFSNPIAIQGCYWRDAGVAFRRKLTHMEVPVIKNDYPNLINEAEGDIKNRIQAKQKDALGVWILSEVEKGY